jgi:hypothetical protein
MPLGVNLPDCPCARCQTCAPLVQRLTHAALAPRARAADDDDDAPTLNAPPNRSARARDYD